MDKKILQDRVDEINSILEAYLPESNGYNDELCEAIRYSVMAGGKRIRPILMQEAFRLFSPGREEPEVLHALMAAIEFIHTYSLVHDDLPAMDNDELRRGMPTAHAKYGEAAAILVGDALLNLAYEIILRSLEYCDDPEYYLSCISASGIIASKAGLSGMVGGQYMDVYSEKHPEFEMDPDKLNYIYENKTCALIEAALMAGAVLGQAMDIEIDMMEALGRRIGMAFQIRDDVLDISGSQEVTGKPVGSDAKNDRQTYVAVYGMDEALRSIQLHSDNAIGILNTLKQKNAFLKELVTELISREK